MPTTQQIENALKQVHDQKSFFQDLLATTLEWPLADAQQVDDIAYGWSQSDLNAAGLERSLVEGSIWQIQPSAAGQPWGVFVLQFKDESSLSPRRGLAGVLRTVLKGLVGSRRKDARLPSWKREHLLFICTHDWKSFRFAYYRSKPDEPRSAKLTTFGWSPDTSNRTVVEFNLPALVWPEDPTDAESWVSAWAKAFDKEPLTKDFFKRFDKALEAIKADLQSYQKLSSPEAYTQSQLLLERLIFLYFLQNRGWLNQEHRYLASRLSEHTDNPDGFTYYHDFLDKLFWTLSTAPSGAGRLAGIPFLNGGLFDDDEFRQPASLRKTTPPLRVRNRSMKFVFQELLEAFNFTVTEDTPLHQEVAVDPEMLGKVFESIILHAEAADPDAIAPDKRKATGSYYTPRIVVHFICQEVLYQYLLNHLPGNAWESRLKALFSIDPTEGIDEEAKQLLKKAMSPEQAIHVRELVLPLKCCDPAVGSGAFPVGLMHELVNLRRLLETVANGYKDPVVSQGSEWLHKAKAEIVENCLFGVDIQQQAIEICRLRLWLSLIVDYDLGLDPFRAEKSQFSRAIERISQLPNLEMNFRRGDSLHDHISGVPVVILRERASRYAPQFAAISKLGAELHKAKKAERKKNLRLDILEKRLSLSRAILDEELKEIRTRDSSLDSLFGMEESASKKRDRNQREIENLERASTKVESDQKDLEKLRRRDADSQFYPKLRKLEGADFDSPFNFAWSIDFPTVFGSARQGFDITVGNPPFVTARNPQKRELWRNRWPRVSAGTYQLVCPFIELGTTLLTSQGQLGFIVSNAFAKRDFGKPLVENFLSEVDLQRVVDCSGLSFPGHGTPTCILFIANRKPDARRPISATMTLPGGGDLRTPPEESPLWRSMSEHYRDADGIATPGARSATKVFEDARIAVGGCDRKRFLEHPCVWSFFEWPVIDRLDATAGKRLSDLIEGDIGFCTKTNADDIFVVDVSLANRMGLDQRFLLPYHQGEEIKNWTAEPPYQLITPYDRECQILEEKDLDEGVLAYLRPFKSYLEQRHSFGNKTFKELGWKWYAFDRMNARKYKNDVFVTFPFISTHNHYVGIFERRSFSRHAQVIKLPVQSTASDVHVLLAVLNSSTSLFWLKQICFNKGAGEEEERDRFEFAGGKVQTIPFSKTLAGLGSSDGEFVEGLAALSESCTAVGNELAKQSYKRTIAEASGKSADAEGWNLLFHTRIKSRNALTSRAIALQEEMDWLVYASYNLLPAGNMAHCVELEPEPLDRSERPYKLWERSNGNYDKAVDLIPHVWSTSRRRVWEARLTAIRDNDYIRRIEQPVYKRRWEEQWKVGNEWRCGDVAYAVEFIDAFEWWLKEKAEWWLEHKKAGGPVELIEWTSTLWKEAQVQAAWPVASERYAYVEHELACEKARKKGEPAPTRRPAAIEFSGFARKFKQAIEEETVPDGFPFGIDYDDLKKRLKKDIPAKLKNVRGKLNVPRERFHLVGPGQYKWAGLQFKTGL